MASICMGSLVYRIHALGKHIYKEHRETSELSEITSFKIEDSTFAKVI